MRRIAAACLASLLLYIGLFASVLDRPLTLGALRARIEANIARGAAIGSPKLVILAGSNGPYSHRCEAIEPLLHRPCVNAGVAVGVGLDYLFARWKPLLRRGDVVYLPLEEAQYARPRAVAALGPDAAIMLRHDRTTLADMPWDRRIAALFASDLRGAVMSVLETGLVEDGFTDPRAAATGTFNAWGDHVGHTALLGAGNQLALAAFAPFHPSAAQVAHGYGTAVLAAFLDWAEAHGVHTIGGLPTGFADSPIQEEALAAIETIYRSHGAGFLKLPNHSRYPRDAFFDTADHLNEAAQIRHSLAVAAGLAAMLPATPAHAISRPAAIDNPLGTPTAFRPALMPTGITVGRREPSP
jgi:hypothetical protein